MKKQSGFTLIEIMIALLLGVIVIVATMNIYIATIKSSSDTANAARLNHDLEMAMALMVNDIKRAGFWGGAIAGSDAENNVFTVGTANIQMPIGSCVLYTYDADSDGAVDGNEYYGFRLNAGLLQIRLSGTTTADCADGVWQTIADETDINITGLTFSFSAIVAPALPATSQCFNVTTITAYPTPCSSVIAANLASGERAVETRQVNIVITGQLVNDATVTKTLTGTVKVRNDRVFTQP